MICGGFCILVVMESSSFLIAAQLVVQVGMAQSFVGASSKACECLTKCPWCSAGSGGVAASYWSTVEGVDRSYWLEEERGPGRVTWGRLGTRKLHQFLDNSS